MLLCPVTSDFFHALILSTFIRMSVNKQNSKTTESVLVNVLQTFSCRMAEDEPELLQGTECTKGY